MYIFELFSDVRVGFQSEHISRMESQGNAVICIEMEGELEKTITVAVSSTNGMHGIIRSMSYNNTVLHTLTYKDTLNIFLVEINQCG